MRFGIVIPRLMVVLFGFAGTALAHPGHGATDPQTVTHYATEPVHTFPLLLIVATSVGISLLAVRYRKSR